ncbi:MAG: hypothetical protein LBH80_08780 [Prevotellaceae bacterium]|nr:hypothetical protein [Prevotellaceae bacterium]
MKLHNPKSIIPIVLLFVFPTLQSQQTITNVVTRQHKKIVGTNISIIPPDGFSNSFVFTGFQQDKTGASIMIVNTPGIYKEMSLTFTKTKLKENGLNVKQIEDIVINNIPAKFATTEQNIFGNIYTKYILMLGNDDEIFFISGSYPNVFKNQVDLALKNAILSTVIENTSNETPPNEHIFHFSLNNDHSEFILLKRDDDFIRYNISGISDKNSKSPVECSLTVSRQVLKKPVEDKLGFSIKELNKYTIKEIESIHSVESASLSGFEIIIKTNDDKMIYQQTLFGNDCYYLFLGTINDKFEKNLKEIRQLNQTFKINSD